MRITISVLVLAPVLALSGCAENLPETSQTISSAALDADYPALLPLDALLARAEAGSSIEAQTETLEARVALLKRKAAALKGRSVVDGATRLKLLEAAQRNADRRGG